MKPTIFLLVTLFLSTIALFGQEEAPKDASPNRPYVTEANSILSTGLTTCDAYKILHELTAGVGHRLSGSPEAARAVAWARHTMDSLGFENVHAESVMVPHWVRGKTEKASILKSGSHPAIPLHICALGGSISTPKKGITAEVVEVRSFDELSALGEKAKGKIIFYNRPMDPTKISTFEAYGGAVDQRWRGAIEASRIGGVASLVRSMTTRLDDVPHTGVMGYNDSIPKVPSAAVSTIGAEKLSALLKSGEKVMLSLNFDAQTLPDNLSWNVLGEIRGTEHPEQVIVIGGHMDSWDKGQGAHDDGAGIAHSMEALRLIKTLNLHPKRTIRVVCFMNEENGGRGGRAYVAKDRPGETCIAAIESDAGGFTPRGFGVSCDSIKFDKFAKWSYLLGPMDADNIHKGGGGSDIGPLGTKGVPMLGLNVDSQRYFDYHHSESDTFDKVNERELELGAAAVGILAYVIAQEGI